MSIKPTPLKQIKPYCSLLVFKLLVEAEHNRKKLDAKNKPKSFGKCEELKDENERIELLGWVIWVDFQQFEVLRRLQWPKK